MTVRDENNNRNDKDFIRIQGLSKHFGDFTAVDSIDLNIERGELFSILGGSGCGKTTLLRMLAGLETPDSGSVFIDGIDVSDQPPYERPVNMMFQSYAIFPHMTVEKNIAYGLQKDRIAPSEIEARVAGILDLVKLSELRSRRPDQLSGGQRQRVALARALIKRPKVLLLDEPLAALDKKLREHTQFELMNIQDQLGTTFVVVTHDQEEAMILSTRIAVMEKGRFEQVGTPKEIYEYPKNRFVADFIGTINTFDGIVEEVNDGSIGVKSRDIEPLLRAFTEGTLKRGDAVCIAVRPEKIFISQHENEDKNENHGDQDMRARGIVEDLGYFGNLSLYRIRLNTGKIVQVSAQNRRRSTERFLEWDDEVFVSWRPQSAIVLTD